MKNGYILFDLFIHLLILSLILHALYISIHHYRHVFYQQQEAKQMEFQQFLVLLEHELDDYSEIQIDGPNLSMRRISDNRKMWLKCQNYRIYITPGYHPLLFEVESWQLTVYKDLLFISVLFTNGEYFHGQVMLNDK